MRSLVIAFAAVAALAAAPAFAAAAPAPAAATTTTTTKTKSAGTSKMSGCASQWKAMSAADQAKYKDKAKTMKSKKGGTLSGYNVWTGECMKKA